MTVTLFDPIQLGDYHLKNRIFMAPMTRARTGPEGIPNELVATYYAQRASAGLIITEATAVHPRGHGWPGAPGIYTDQQQEGWAKVSKAVHAKGGRIFMQIWHMGRAVLRESIQGQQALAPSAIAADGMLPNSEGIPTAFETPEVMSISQIKEAVSAFADAARRAVDAGLDGVEIHAANNFLIDAFLRDGTNQRDDEYGGSIENRCKFLLEVVDAIIAKIGAGKVGIRFSPTNAMFGIKDTNPEALFTHAARQLTKRNLAYLHVLEPALDSGNSMVAGLPPVAPALRESYDGLMILNGSLNQETGQDVLSSNAADAVAFGTPYISNPDLVERYENLIALTEPNPETFYGGGAEGYTDYAAKEVENA